MCCDTVGMGDLHGSPCPCDTMACCSEWSLDDAAGLINDLRDTEFPPWPDYRSGSIDWGGGSVTEIQCSSEGALYLINSGWNLARAAFICERSYPKMHCAWVYKLAFSWFYSVRRGLRPESVEQQLCLAATQCCWVADMECNDDLTVQWLWSWFLNVKLISSRWILPVFQSWSSQSLQSYMILLINH